MQLANHYIRLREVYPARESVYVETTLEQLAEALCCSDRNVKFLLKKMQLRGWLHWESRRGRGNRSRLLFLVTTEHIFVELAKEQVMKKNISAAYQILSSAKVSSSALRSFQLWLGHYFGYVMNSESQLREDTLRLPIPRPFADLDPALIPSVLESHLITQLFDSLIVYDRRTISLKPNIAHHWKVNDTGTEWTFHLRKGIFFHDGNQLTSEDVAFTFERFKDPHLRSPHGWMFSDVEKVIPLDPITVRFILKKPNELFPLALCTNRASIVPRDSYMNMKGKFAQMPVGTGPFKIVKNEKDICVLEAFVPYFKGRPHLDKVEMWVVPDLGDDETFQLVYTSQMNLSHTYTQLRNVISQNVTSTLFLVFNAAKDGPLRDRHVRRHLFRLLEGLNIANGPSGEGVLPVRSFLDDLGELVELEKLVDLEKLKELPDIAVSTPLTEEATNEEFSIEARNLDKQIIRLFSDKQFRPISQKIVQLCNSNGIRVEIVEKEKHTETDGFLAYMDLLLLRTVPGDNPIEIPVTHTFRKIRDFVPPSLSGQIDRFMTMITNEPDYLKRLQIIMQTERLLYKEHTLFLIARTRLDTAIHPSLRGVSLESIGWYRFKEMWFDPR